MLFNKAFLIDIISTPDKNNQIYTNKIIETIAIVSIVISEKIDKISFMKIDLEGAEVLVLNGAIETLKQMRIDTMITEFHSHGDYIILSNSGRVRILNNLKKATPKSIRILNTRMVILQQN